MIFAAKQFSRTQTTPLQAEGWKGQVVKREVIELVGVFTDLCFYVMILDSSVERARVGCWRRVWVVASTLNATAYKEEQHPQTRRQ